MAVLYRLTIQTIQGGAAGFNTGKGDTQASSGLSPFPVLNPTAPLCKLNSGDSHLGVPLCRTKPLPILPDLQLSNELGQAVKPQSYHLSTKASI